MNKMDKNPSFQEAAAAYFAVRPKRALPLMLTPEIPADYWENPNLREKVERLVNSEVLASGIPLGTSMESILKRYK